MSPRRDPDHDLQRLLDEDGGDYGAIYRRLSRPEPPRRLDRVVLANAARAVHGGRAPPAQRWMLGIGSAAGVVLAAGIAWQVGKQLESRDAETGGSLERSHPSVIAVQPISEPAVSKKAESDTATSDQSAPAPATSVEERKPDRASRQRAARPAPPVPAPSPAAAAPEVTQIQPQAERANSMAADAEAEPFPPAKDLPEAQGAPGSIGELGKSDRRERADEAAGAAREKSLGSPEPMQSRAPAPTSSVQLRQNMRLPPEEWLAEIVRLKREGHRQQAIENLRLFRRMHPDWKLSNELLRLSQ